MEIDLTKLTIESPILYDEDIEFDSKIYTSADIVSLKNIHIKGSIKVDSLDNIFINLNLTGIMSLRDSITLDIIDKPLDIKISEEYSLEDEYFKEYYIKTQNILDIMAILWENIVLEVPMRLTNNENVELSGEGWSFGGNKNNDDNIDPRLAELAKLLDEGKE